MKDYPIRYQSLRESYFTLNTGYNSGWTNTDTAVYTPEGKWVTVWLPSDPRLTPSENAQVRAQAKAATTTSSSFRQKRSGP